MLMCRFRALLPPNNFGEDVSELRIAVQHLFSARPLLVLGRTARWDSDVRAAGPPAGEAVLGP